MIEIRELVIRATVDSSADARGQQADQANGQQAAGPALHEVVEQLAEMIKERNER